jgi:hypothetical protein
MSLSVMAKITQHWALAPSDAVCPRLVRTLRGRRVGSLLQHPDARLIFDLSE